MDAESSTPQSDGAENSAPLDNNLDQDPDRIYLDHTKPFPSFAHWVLRRHILLPLQQYVALLKKNTVLFLRSWVGTCVLLLAPVVLMVALELLSSAALQVMIQSAVPDDPQPEMAPIGKLGPCVVGPSLDHCRIVSYTPPGAPYDDIIRTLLHDNGLPLEGTHQAFDNAELLREDLLEHPNVTLFAIVFQEEGAEKRNTGVGPEINHVHYNLLYNGSILVRQGQPVLGIALDDGENLDYIHTVQYWMHQAILKNHISGMRRHGAHLTETQGQQQHGGGGGRKGETQLELLDHVAADERLFDISLAQFPTVGTNVTVGTEQEMRMQIFFLLGQFFIQMCFCPFWMVGVYYMVAERENLQRWSLTMMGMKNWTYWASWLTSLLAIALLSVSAMIGTGALVGIDLFLNTNPLVLLLLFMPYALVMISLAFIIASFVSSVRTALILSLTANALVIISGMFIFNSLVIQGLYVGADIVDWIGAVVTFLEWTSPVFHVGKSIAEIIPVAYSGRYFALSDMAEVHIKGYTREAPTMWGSIGFMLLHCAVLCLFTWCE